MVKGTTESGFSFKIARESLDDYELFEALCDIDGGNSAKFPKVVRALLGKEQEEKLKEHVKNNAGKITITGMLSEVTAILNACQSGKNS